MNIDFSARPAFSAYVLLLMASGVAMVILASPAVKRQGTLQRVLNVAFGLGFFCYGFYLAFVFNGGSYVIFFKAFILPVLLIARTIRGAAAGSPTRTFPASPPPFTYPASVQTAAPLAHEDTTTGWPSAPVLIAAPLAPAGMAPVTEAAPAARHSAGEDPGAASGYAFNPAQTGENERAPLPPGLVPYVPPPWEPISPNDLLPINSYGYSAPTPPRTRRRYLTAATMVVVAAAAGIVWYATDQHRKTQTAALPSTSDLPPASAIRTALQNIPLTLADFPAFWTGTPYQDDPNSASDDAAMSKCIGGHYANTDGVTSANSDDFTDGNAIVSSAASQYRSQGEVNRDAATLLNPKVPGCFDQLIRKQSTSSPLPAGAKLATVSIKLTPGSAGGPTNVIATAEGKMILTANGHDVPIYLTVAFITGPLIEADVTTENVGAPLPASLLQSLVTAVANRAATG